MTVSDDGSDSNTLERGTAHGCQFRVDHVRGKHFAGYVRTDFGDQWHCEDFTGFPYTAIEAHGGLTYGVDEGGWIGFDFAHAGDTCILDGEVQTDYGGVNNTEWTPEDVAAECRKVARQVEGVGELFERFEDIGWGHPGDGE